MLLPLFFILTLVGLLLAGVTMNLYLHTHNALSARSTRYAKRTSALHEAIFQ